jgi:argininosuccinate lyase
VELQNDFLTATEIADYLVRKGTTFREAHSITGKIVAHAIEHKKSLTQLSLSELRHFSSKLDEDLFPLLDPHKSIEHKKSSGSTSPQEVKKQIVHWTRVLKNRKV